MPRDQSFDDKPPGTSNGRMLRGAKRVLKEKLDHLLHIQGCGTVEKSASIIIDISSSLVSTGETKLDETKFLKNVTGEITGLVNDKLMERYAKSGIIKFNLTAINSEEAPMLNYFHIPFAPVIIRKILQHIVKLNSLFPDMDLLPFDTFGRKGKHTLIPMPQASTPDVFMKKGSRDVICQIPGLLVYNPELKLIKNEKEKKEKTEMEKLKRIKLIIQSLMGSDPEVKTIVKDIAREELGLVQTNMCRPI